MKYISVPSSKSVSVRAIFLSAISDVPTVLQNVLECDDTRFLIESLTRFGVQFVKLSNGNLKVIPPEIFEGNEIDNFIGNAGTPTRFLVALSLITKGSFSLRGVPRMHERPFKDLFDAVRSLGVEIVSEKQKDFLPAKFIAPTCLDSNKVQISGSISSQFLSGLLLVASKLPQ